MPHTSSITYLPLPSWLEASVEEARSATSNTVVSDSQRWAFEFELPVNEGVKRVVDEVKKVYLVCRNTPGNIDSILIVYRKTRHPRFLSYLRTGLFLKEVGGQGD